MANVGAIREKTLIYLSIIQRLFFYLRAKIAYKKFAYVFILQWMPRDAALIIIFPRNANFFKNSIPLINIECC